MRRKLNKRWTEPVVVRPCPLCSGQDTRILSREMQHQLNMTTVLCNRCGFVHTNPVPPEDVYNRFYTEAYADYYGDIAGSAPVISRSKNRRTLL